VLLNSSRNWVKGSDAVGRVCRLGIGGHVDGIQPALIGGAVTGAGIGFVQWMFLRRDLNMSWVWILATSAALAAGLSVGSAVVGYETTAGQLAIMGAISGVPVGIAQGALLRNKLSLWHAWMVAMPALFALGWVVSESIGIDVANQFTIFGASGSVVFGLLSGLLLMAGKRISVVMPYERGRLADGDGPGPVLSALGFQPRRLLGRDAPERLSLRVRESRSGGRRVR
jgi:hypothetical protein